MPTGHHGKVRHLLKNGRARVVRRCPFTIRLLYDTTRFVQKVDLGIDAGSVHIGSSACCENKELYAGDTVIRNDIVKLLSKRREARRTRRNRKTRYRAPRFDNRKREEGWLAPSIRNKIGSHLSVVRQICQILPITSITVETASFDIQKIRHPEISGEQYQQGEQLGFWNVREYVLFRDGHKCQCCKGKSKNPVLNVHHIESRQTGGNAPNNLITLCETCHKGYHNGTVTLPKKIRRGMKFHDAAFMGIMRWAFFNKLKSQYEPLGIPVNMTYGYITKNTRIRHGLEKDHAVDARCISGHPDARPLDLCYRQRKVRCHNRKLYKDKTLKHGVHKRNQAERIVLGYRLYDRVRYHGNEYFVFGRRATGYFDLRDLDGNKVNKGSISIRKFRFLEPSGYYLTLRERRMVVSSHD